VLSCNQSCSGKAVSIVYSECVFVTVGILSYVALSAVQYFATLSDKRRHFRKDVTEHKMCVLIFSTTLSKTFLLLRRNKRDKINKYIGLHVKYSLFLSDFNETCISSTDFRKILKYQISLKFVQ
jgi:hypothetical protein